jgi:hypothetical protein
MRPSAISRVRSRGGRASLVAGAAGALLALAAPAAAAAVAATAKSKPAVCEGQVLTQPFLAYGDSHDYTLAPGGEFNSASEGWTLSGGAKIVTALRPTEKTGGVLSLPGGSKAVSPPMCVTLHYPMARAWIDSTAGSRPVRVSVSYAGTPSELAPQEVGTLKAKRGAWTLGKFGVEPALGGAEEAPRQVQFVFEGAAKGTNEIWGVWVDPRMR